MGMKILKVKHLSFHNSYHSSIKDSKKLEMHIGASRVKSKLEIYLIGYLYRLKINSVQSQYNHQGKV